MMANHTSERGLSVVVPSWNGRALLEKFLSGVVAAAAAFEAACRAPTEVLVADDASSDDTLAWLVARFPQVRFEASPEASGQGFAPTANRGIAAARYRLVYLVNNDVALEPASLPPLAAHFEDPCVFAVASQVYDYTTGVLRGAGQLGEFRRGFLSIHRRYFVQRSATGDQRDSSGPVRAEDERKIKGALAPDTPTEPWLTLYASGGSSMFDREKFLALGGFDELFAPFGWEDVEVSLRAWKHGYEVRYEPRSAVWHQFSSTIAPQFARRHVRAIYERNRLFAHWLHLDTPTQAAAHVFFLLLKLLASPFVGRWETWSATAQALARWGAVRARREKRRAPESRNFGTGQRALRDILAQLADQFRRPEAQPLTPRTAPVRRHP